MASGLDGIAAYEHELLEYATTAISQLTGVRIIGTAPSKASVISFAPHDVGTILNREGVAVRTGHHCAQPVLDHSESPPPRELPWPFTTLRRRWML